MNDEKNLQSEKLDDEELEKVSGGRGGHAVGSISSDPFDWKKKWFYNGEEPKNNSGSISKGREVQGGH